MGSLARAARLGDNDKGICVKGCKLCPHLRTGRITSGSSNVIIEGKGAARQGDKTNCQCPHGGNGQIMRGSATVFANGKPMVRVRDNTKCDKCGLVGTVITGASTVFVGE